MPNQPGRLPARSVTVAVFRSPARRRGARISRLCVDGNSLYQRAVARTQRSSIFDRVAEITGHPRDDERADCDHRLGVLRKFEQAAGILEHFSVSPASSGRFAVEPLADLSGSGGGKAISGNDARIALSATCRCCRQDCREMAREIFSHDEDGRRAAPVAW